MVRVAKAINSDRANSTYIVCVSGACFYVLIRTHNFYCDFHSVNALTIYYVSLLYTCKWTELRLVMFRGKLGKSRKGEKKGMY